MKYRSNCAKALGVSLVALLTSAQAGEAYRFLKEIPVGGEGGWDYLATDAARHRLYVSHATKVVVIDTVTDTVIGEIADTPGVHGIAVAPELGHAYTSNGKDNSVSVVDLASLKTLTKVTTGTNPDAVMFEPGSKEIYAFNGRSASATVIAGGNNQVVATIPLGGKPEFAQADPAVGFVYDNIEDKNEVAVIDIKTHAVVARWSVTPGDEPSGMDIDLAHHRLFIGCGNAKVVVLDSVKGQVVAVIPAGAGIDATAFDPGTQLVFASNGRDGTVTIAHEDSPDTYTVVQTLKTERSARTMAVDQSSHKIYLASAKFAEPIAGSTKRPPMLPGSFKLLVYGLTP